MNGGIGIIEMLKRTNLLALVGGGINPKFPTNQLIIWDDHQGKIISKLRFNDNIISVRLRNDKIIVLTRNKFYAFIHYDSARLFQCAMEIQYKLETGSLETKEELEKMKLLSPEQRDALHNKNLESAEGLMCLLFAAARDKVNILELVKTLPNSRTR